MVSEQPNDFPGLVPPKTPHDCLIHRGADPLDLAALVLRDIRFVCATIRNSDMNGAIADFRLPPSNGLVNVGYAHIHPALPAPVDRQLGLRADGRPHGARRSLERTIVEAWRSLPRCPEAVAHGRDNAFT